MVASSINNLGLICRHASAVREEALIESDLQGKSRSWSAHELDTLAQAHARRLRARGLARGQRVALLSENSAAFLAAYFGILRAGLVAVPLNHRLPPALIDAILADSDAAALLVGRLPDPQLPQALKSPVTRLPLADGLPALSDEAQDGVADMAPDEPALILYTSGSTGRPKGVVISHHAYLWTLRTRLSGRSLSSECYLVAAPLYHMNALNTVQLALAGQARLVLQPHFEAGAYAQAIARHGCTSLTGLPTMIALMHASHTARSADLSSVHTVRLGSEPLSERLLDMARQLFPQASVGNAYGTTETGSVIFGPRADGTLPPPLALGWPHPQVQLRLLDTHGQPAQQGVLAIRSPALMLGYHGLPEQTARAMTADGYYLTGDILRRDAEGCHYFVGRADDMFVCGGENIYPADVERMLERHADIERACVIPVADGIKGRKPVALVVLRAQAQTDESAIRQYALDHGPAHQHPRRVFIVPGLPSSATGKTDRKAAAALVAQLLAST